MIYNMNGVLRQILPVGFGCNAGHGGVALANPATDNQANRTAPRPQVQMVVFDWMGQKQVTPASNARVAKWLRNGYIGRGSYICSPSGFGKRSTCFSR